MKLRLSSCLVTIALLGLGPVCGMLYAQDDDPVIDSKPLSHWIKQLQSENRGFQLRAAQALSKAESNHVAKVIPSLMPLLKSERENDRFVAAQTLGNYGSPARAAVPELLPLLKGTQYERNRAAAAKALGQILKDAQPGEEVEKVTAAIVDAWGDKYEDVRRECVFALGMIGTSAKSCIPKLDERLNDAQPVRNAAAWTCGRMGRLAADKADKLISIMQGERYPQVDHFFAAAAVEALGKIGAVHANVVPNIVNRLESIGAGTAFHPQADGAAVRVCYLRGVNALERLGPDAASATSYLQRVISGNPYGDKERSLAIVNALGAIGPGAAEAIPTIQKIADAKPGSQDGSAVALQKAAVAAIEAIKKPASK
ncbi:MAG: hypothetical protein C0404_04030 [Verrucomicrobia bacterium]|nr:hypothetical protein [Verrucomicrobiota bacterium]